MSTLTTSLQHRIGSASHSNQTRKRKGNYIGWKEVKLSLYTDDMITYTENPKAVFPHKTTRTDKQIQQAVAGYKINLVSIQKSVPF